MPAPSSSLAVSNGHLFLPRTPGSRGARVAGLSCPELIIYRLLDVVREVAAEVEAQYGGAALPPIWGDTRNPNTCISMSDSEILGNDTCGNMRSTPENCEQAAARDGRNAHA